MGRRQHTSSFPDSDEISASFAALLRAASPYILVAACMRQEVASSEKLLGSHGEVVLGSREVVLGSREV